MDFFESVRIKIFMKNQKKIFSYLKPFSSETQCLDRSSSPATLGLHNMIGKK